MARPPSNAARLGSSRALAKLPKPRLAMTREELKVYAWYGKLLLDAGKLAETDLPILEEAAETRATLDALRDDPERSEATVAALKRLLKEQLVQLGLTPTARRAVQRLESAPDAAGERMRGLLE